VFKVFDLDIKYLIPLGDFAGIILSFGSQFDLAQTNHTVGVHFG